MSNSSKKQKSKSVLPNATNPKCTDMSETLRNQIDDQRYVYDLVNSWIRNVESKITIATSLSIGLFGVVTYLADRIDISDLKDTVAPILLSYNYLFFGGAIMLFISTAVYVSALIPNLRSNARKPNSSSNRSYPLYFGDIVAEKEINIYRSKIMKATYGEILEEFIYETHHNSRICSMKMKKFKWGVWLSIISFVLAVLGLMFKWMVIFK